MPQELRITEHDYTDNPRVETGTVADRMEIGAIRMDVDGEIKRGLCIAIGTADGERLILPIMSRDHIDQLLRQIEEQRDYVWPD